MVEKLVDGGNDAFTELSHNIMEYHRGYISSHVPTDVDVSGGDTENYITNVLNDQVYNLDLYNNIVKIYIEIGNGLDIVAKNIDDRLIIFDDIIQKAGFMLTLQDRFNNNIKSITDLTYYGLADIELGDAGQKNEVYLKILAEINDYPKLTKQIADAAKAIRLKIEYISDLIATRQETILAFSETLNEIKIFIDAFNDQYKILNIDIVKGLYTRLKELAVKADNCINDFNPTPENINEDNDFFAEAVLSTLEENDAINDIIMEVLLKEYYAEREFKERGVRLVYEADTTDNTSVKVTDNSGTSTGIQTTNATTTAGVGGAVKNKLSNLLKSISEWFQKMITSFDELLGRQKAKNTKWLAANKDGLMNRSYTNVEIQILPYDKMPSKQVLTDISKLATNVNAMNPQNLQTANTYEDLRTRLINFGPKFTKDDEKITIINYYKVGNNPVQTVPYANNNIKSLVVNEMIPYCEAFYDSYKEEVKKQLNALKTSLENISKSHVTEAVCDIDELCGIFTEADATTQPTTSTKPNQTANTASKNGWVKQCVQTYSGCVLNAIRDRNNDYFKVLYALAPKKAVPTAQPQTTDANQAPAKK